jgi:transcriptional regulator with XRE-family HTH domain
MQTMTRQALPKQMMGTSAPQRLRLQLVAAEFLERMGDRIRERRENLGYSRSDVARLMPGKTSENQVYRWEKGLHQPNPDTLQALAEALDCAVSDLMSPTPDKSATPDLFAVSDDEDGQLQRIEERLDEVNAKIEGLHAMLERWLLETVDDAAVRRIIEHATQDRPQEQPPRA